MNTRILIIIVTIASTMMLIGFTYYSTDFTFSETEQECDMGIHTAYYGLDFANSTYRNQYVIKNGCVDEISHNQDEHSLMITFHKTEDGTIRITLPEFLYDLRPRSEHVVLSDDPHVEFEQLVASALQINFTENTKNIEIVDFMSTSEFSNMTVHNADKDAALQIKKILYHCNTDENIIGTVYEFLNSTHYIDSDICEWQKDFVLADILEKCEQIKQTGTFGGFAYGASWQNSTYYIDNNICEWREK
ncbi:MAG: hypothetical protein GKS07_10005 [Nitrosopumilus sp.]|nr:MAG: hypothetical protein GKS07_10005 [Nitrosopumilus sp.]